MSKKNTKKRPKKIAAPIAADDSFDFIKGVDTDGTVPSQEALTTAYFNISSDASLDHQIMMDDEKNDKFLHPLDIFKAVHPGGPPGGLDSMPTISIMPDRVMAGVVEWPGIPPNTLEDLARKHSLISMIHNLRIDDVLKYSALSKQPWKPGWRIVLREPLASPTKRDYQRIWEMEQFILNSSVQYQNPIERDAHHLLAFPQFLAAITRNTLTYDGLAIWTQRDRAGRIISYAPVNSGNVRLVAHVDADGSPIPDLDFGPDTYAVVIDNSSNIRYRYTRNELLWTIRNRRLEPYVGGYGWSELEQGIDLIRGFAFALDYNLDMFDHNSIPNGILALKGRWNQDGLNKLERIWRNIKAGANKAFYLPIMWVPDEGEVNFIELKHGNGNEMWFKSFLNMVVGGLSIVYGMPATRLGYHTSGATSDPSIPESVQGDDIGRTALLQTIENLIDGNIVASRDPTLRFEFTAKDPNEEARMMQLRQNAMLYGERRAAADLPPLEQVVDKKYRDVALLLSMMPTDPALAGMAQTIIAAAAGNTPTKAEDTKAEDTKPVGAVISNPKDPATTAHHGNKPVIRRDSRKEKDKDKLHVENEPQVGERVPSTMGDGSTKFAPSRPG